MRSLSASRWLLALLLAASVRAAAQDAGQPDDVTVTQMDGVGGLRVDGCRLDGGTAAAVFGRAGLAGTRELWLADTHLTRDALDALLASRVARDIEVVWLNDRVVLEPGGIRALLRLSRLRRLQPATQVDARPDELVDANALSRRAPVTVALDLERFSDEQLGRMARSSARALRVAVQARGDQLVRLERTGALKMVSELDATCPAPCIRRLARSGRLGALESLALNCHHTVETARALAGARLPRLRSLALTYDAETCQDDQGRAPRGIGPAGVTALLAAPWAAQLRELRLVGQQLGEPGARAIAAAPELAGLRVLVIGTDPLGARAVEQLVGAATFAAGLETLRLVGSDVEGEPSTLDSAALAALSRSARLPALRTLEVGFNKRIDEAAVRALGAAAWVRRLRRLEVTGLPLAESLERNGPAAPGWAVRCTGARAFSAGAP